MENLSLQVLILSRLKTYPIFAEMSTIYLLFWTDIEINFEKIILFANYFGHTQR